MEILRRWKQLRNLKRMARANNIVHNEGHLGGFVRSSSTPAPSGLDVTNGDPATWTPKLWRWGVEALGIKSVLDVGCGEGHCASYFRSLGCEVAGVDGSSAAREASKIPDAHHQHDFQKAAYIPTREFDLVWSCEFVEHVHERFSGNFLRTFSAAQKFLMITYAPPGQAGWHHVNCQPDEYWIEQIDRIGFDYSQLLTQEARSQCEDGHFRTKGLVFVRR